MTQAPTFKVFGVVLKWVGLTTVAVGAIGSAYAVMTAVQTRTGWGLSSVERCCMRGDLNKAALALLLGSMFFVVAGAGVILIARPLARPRPNSRWPRWLARSLYVYSACTVALAVILIRELGDRTLPGASLVGLVSYCLLVAVGLLIASWGLKRFAETG